MGKHFISIFSISLLVFASISITKSYSELYIQYDGTYITEEEYEERVIICANEKLEGKLDQNVDCLQWALTQNAQSQKAFNELISKYR